MGNSNDKLKNTFNQIIGEKPLVKEMDKLKFHQWLEKERKPRFKKYWIPRFITIMLLGVVTFLLITFLPTHIPLEDLNNGTPKTQEIPTDSLKEDNYDNRVALKDVERKIDEIISKFKVDMTIEEVQEVFGEGGHFTGVTEGEGRRYEALEYLYFTRKDSAQLHLPFMEGDHYYKNGDLGLNFNVMWYEDGKTTAFIDYLNEKNELVTVQFNSDGSIFNDNHFIGNNLYQIDASGVMVESIANSIGKNPKDITLNDINYLEELTIQYQDHERPWDQLFLQADYDLMRKMEKLRLLHLKDVAVPYYEISTLTNLEVLSLENVEIGDLAEFLKLENLKYLNIYETNTSTVSRIVDHPSLEVVILDKQKVKDWELLEEKGIKVQGLETSEFY